MTPERKIEIDKQIVWWRRQEKLRVEGFNIIQSDPMYKRMTETYHNRKEKDRD